MIRWHGFISIMVRLLVRFANADKSKNGMAQSCGVMVNYRYDLSRISENHEAFANQQTVIAEKSVKTLAAEIEITDRAM